MADKYVFENEDSDDQKAEEEEQTTLAARDTWVGSILNFSKEFFKCSWIRPVLNSWICLQITTISWGGGGQLHSGSVQGGNIFGEGARENNRRWDD